jgi:hypothetical protein
LERAFTGARQAGIEAIGFKGGSLTGAVTLAFTVRWEDGRISTGVLIAEDVVELLSAQASDLVELTLNVPLDPAALQEFRGTAVG